MMKTTTPFGYYLFQKHPGPSVALKDMLQFMKSNSPGRTLQFAHVEGENSLIPHLTLWENLHVVSGGASWSELLNSLEMELQNLARLIQNPDLLSKEASNWERLTISLIKAALMNTTHIMVDIDEAHHGPINLMNFKKSLQSLAQKKQIFVATSNLSLWEDEAHVLVQRNGYEFELIDLTAQKKKFPKSA